MMKLLFSILASLGICFAFATTTANAQAAAERGVLLLMSESDKAVLSAPFVRAGFVKRSASANQVTPSPLTRDEAVAMGKSASAQVVVSATLRSDKQGNIRSTQLRGYSSELHLKVWDVVTAELVLDSEMRASGYGKQSADAKAMSTERVVAQSKSAMDALIARVWPSGKNLRATAFSLRVRGAVGWREISSVLQQIARTPGIVSLHILDIRHGRTRFQLQSQQGSASIVSSLRRARITGGTLQVQSQGGAIVVTLKMNGSLDKANG